jgi:hypothetical protein
MVHTTATLPPQATMLALQSNAERAGTALACAYSSSEEFEAAVIRSKLATGVYGPRRSVRNALYAVVAAAAVASILVML